MTTSKSDFMAAEEIKALLHGRDKAEQERIVRWVTESLGLATLPLASGLPNPSLVQGGAAAMPSQHLSHPGSPFVAPTIQKDVRQFVEEKKPKSDTQFATVVAYYYQFEAPSGKQKFVIGGNDIKDAARLANWKRFKKPIDTLHNAVKAGYLDKGSFGEFKLNTVGENLVAMALPGRGKDSQGGATSGIAKKRAGRKAARRKA